MTTTYENIVLVTNDGDGVDITLTTPTYNQVVTFKIINAAAGSVVVTPPLGVKIDGSASMNMGNTQWIRRTIVFNTVTGLWYILNST